MKRYYQKIEHLAAAFDEATWMVEALVATNAPEEAMKQATAEKDEVEKELAAARREAFVVMLTKLSTDELVLLRDFTDDEDLHYSAIDLINEREARILAAARRAG